MVVIQPGLCFDTEKQAETLKFGIQTICWELEANKEEVGFVNGPRPMVFGVFLLPL